MLKIWGRNTSSNVQKAMWAVGEIGLPHERIDIGGSFGGNREPGYLAKNPNRLVPTLEDDDGCILWESNSIVRYLAGKHDSPLRPSDRKVRGRASQWMDWQLSVLNPAITPVFWGLVRTPVERRDFAAIEAAKAKTTAAMQIVDQQLRRTRYLAGDEFTYGDIPTGVIARRYRDLVPERPAYDGLERWFGEISRRPAFREHVSGIPLV